MTLNALPCSSSRRSPTVRPRRVLGAPTATIACDATGEGAGKGGVGEGDAGDGDAGHGGAGDGNNGASSRPAEAPAAAASGAA